METKIETIKRGGNGYPREIRLAYIGFDTYEEAEQFAVANDGEVHEFHKMDGWQLWERIGRAYEPMIVTEEDYGNGYEFVSDTRVWLNEQKERLTELVGNLKPNNFEDIRKELDRLEEICDYIESLDKGEVVVLNDGEYWETISPVNLRWENDSHIYEIGVLLK